MQWFEDNTQYMNDIPVPLQFHIETLSLIRVYPNGKTQPGWGAKEFVDSLIRNAFAPARAIKFYLKYKQPFAFVMRSLPVICVDIDGKNGGIKTAQILKLAPTLAERSRSLNGYHLFYKVYPSIWNTLRGYDEFPDITGLIPGVDIKGTGAVFHYPNQRWNDLDMALLPASLEKLLTSARDVKRHSRMSEGTKNLNQDDLVIIHDELLQQLESRFTPGTRNNKLFAIGAQMYAAGYPSWDIALYDRGVEIGLDLTEITDMITNIEKYS